MKLLNTITTCLFLSFLLIACGEDDPMMEEEVVLGLDGDWEAQSVEFDVVSTTSFLGLEVITTSTGTGKNIDYSLNLDNGNFTTSGAYDFELTTTSNALPDPFMETQNYTDVSGSGTYTNTETELTVDGQFFDFEFNGMSLSSSTGPATASYTIVDNVLTFSQDEEMVTDQGGTATTIKIVSTSVWNRK